MLRRTRRVLFLLFTLLVSAHLGIEEVRAQEDIVPAYQFLIRNKGHVAVIFSLRKGLGPWQDKKLQRKEDHLYEDYDQVWFSPAGQAPIHREVKLGERYNFIFDGMRWDFVKIDPDQARRLHGGARGKEELCDERLRPGSVSALPAAGGSARAAVPTARNWRARLRDRLDPHRLVPVVGLAAVEEFDRLASVRVCHAAPCRHVEVVVVARGVKDAAERRVAAHPLDGAAAHLHPASGHGRGHLAKRDGEPHELGAGHLLADGPGQLPKNKRAPGCWSSGSAEPKFFSSKSALVSAAHDSRRAARSSASSCGRS